MGGWHHFVKPTKFVSINDMGRQGQLTLMPLKLEKNDAEKSYQNLHLEISEISMKQVSFLCKCLNPCLLLHPSSFLNICTSAPPDRGLSTMQMSRKKKTNFAQLLALPAMPMGVRNSK
jgi:hypothetical protein